MLLIVDTQETWISLCILCNNVSVQFLTVSKLDSELSNINNDNKNELKPIVY